MNEQKAFDDPLSGLAFAGEDEVTHKQPTLVYHFSWGYVTGMFLHMQELDEEIPFDDPPQQPPHNQVVTFVLT